MKSSRVILGIAFAAFIVAAAAAPASAGVMCPIGEDDPCYISDNGTDRIDTDCDGIIDNTDEQDADFDGVPDGDPVDNCPEARNGNCNSDLFCCDANNDESVHEFETDAGYQRDWDGDGKGDVCDDSDYDGVTDYLDNCKMVYNPSQDPSVCTDTDADGFEDPIDNCPEHYNPDQQDTDNDGVGDWCDNCRLMHNPGQEDADDNDVGDACDGDDYVYPSINPPDDQDTVTYQGPNYDFGPDRLEGNGFGKGGCNMLASNAAGAGWAIMLIASMAVAIARRRH